MIFSSIIFFFFRCLLLIFLYFCSANGMEWVTARCLTARLTCYGWPFSFMGTPMLSFQLRRFSRCALSLFWFLWVCFTLTNFPNWYHTKGAKTVESYFYKQEIVLNFDRYAHLLEYLRDEVIDLSHNNPNSEFYRRKAAFSKMKVYKLYLHDFEFQVKIGQFTNDGTFNLYSITEP